jgi:hypothetical protein
MKDKWIMVEIETSANTIIERRQCFGLGGKNGPVHHSIIGKIQMKYN